MTATLFLSFLALTVALLALALLRYLRRNIAFWSLAGLVVWLVYSGWLSNTGLLADSSRRPPVILFIAIPLIAFMIWTVTSRPAGQLAKAFPLWFLAGFQTFRVGVELLLHQLWLDRLVPRLMTYEAGNLDIFVGLSAPAMALWASRTRNYRWGLTIWNSLGILLLANIVLRALLTAPGPLHLLASEVPNQAIAQFPFTGIAAFFAPLALFLHLLSMRALGKPETISGG